MENTSFTRLDLRSPLFYRQAPELMPFDCARLKNDAAPELLFCFELDPDQAERIDPEAECLLGKLILAGAGDGSRGDGCLPAGQYLFSQRRMLPGREECVELAIEQQKDVLWERLKPGNCLYIRYLSENDSPVTQLFRPFIF